MTDVLLTTTFGAHRDALQKWASGKEDVVSVAMEDFPKRGMLVSDISDLSQGCFHDQTMQRNSLPAWLWRLLTSLPIARWRRFCTADEIVYKVRMLLGGTAQIMLMRWPVRFRHRGRRTRLDESRRPQGKAFASGRASSARQ